MFSWVRVVRLCPPPPRKKKKKNTPIQVLQARRTGAYQQLDGYMILNPSTLRNKCQKITVGLNPARPSG